MRRLYLAIGACLFVCVSAAPRGETRTYPSVVSDFADDAHFPTSAPPYHRVQVIAYASGMRDYSVGYNAEGFGFQNAATFYFYSRPGNFSSQFDSEKREIIEAHQGVVLTTERAEQFAWGVAIFNAKVAQFRYDDVFNYRRQPLYSELIVLPVNGHLVKVRSTAPLSQASEAEASLRRLMKVVDWSSSAAQ